MVIVKYNFDFELYTNFYEDIKYYSYKDAINHYLLYGKKEGRICNIKHLYEKKIRPYMVKYNDMWSKKIKEVALAYSMSTFKKKIDACFLMTTYNEINNGRFDLFINKLSNNKINNKIPLYIFINEINDETEQKICDKMYSVGLYKLFKSIDIIKIIVDNSTSKITNINNFFLKTILFNYDQYEYVLILETDNYFENEIEDVFTEIMEYVNKPFLVNGSKYSGKIYLDDQSKNHLNGCAIYNRNKLMWLLLIYLEYYMIMYENEHYDILLNRIILECNLNKYYIDNPKIVNLSTYDDINEKYIDYKPQSIMIHQKHNYHINYINNLEQIVDHYDNKCYNVNKSNIYINYRQKNFEWSEITSTYLITMSNYGYVNILNHMLDTVSKSNIKNIIIGCIDLDTYKYYYNKYKCIYYELNVSANIKYYEKDWDKVMIMKSNIIFDYLANCNSNVIYIDGDILVFKNFNDYIEPFFEKFDIIIQEDENYCVGAYGYMPDETLYCAGFMGIKNNKKNMDLFSKNGIDLTSYGCDQVYLNKYVYGKNYYIYRLPFNLFVNGFHLFGTKKFEFNLYIMHMNWDVVFVNEKKHVLMDRLKNIRNLNDINYKPLPDWFNYNTKQYKLYISKNDEGLGNKILSLASIFYLIDKNDDQECKIIINWNSQNFTSDFYFKYFKSSKNGKIYRIYDASVLDQNTLKRMICNHISLKNLIDKPCEKILNFNIPEYYCNKNLTCDEIYNLKKKYNYNVNNNYLDYNTFESIKYSFKNTNTDIRQTYKNNTDTNIMVDWINNVDLSQYVKRIELNNYIKDDCIKLKKNINNEIIGIHFRCKDFLNFHYQNEKLEFIVSKIAHQIKNVTNNLVVYLSSDEYNAIDLFEQHGFTIINKDNEYYEYLKQINNCNVGIHKLIHNEKQQSLINDQQLFDMYFLSLCDLLVKHKYSTFSEISRIWSNLPNECIIYY